MERDDGIERVIVKDLKKALWGRFVRAVEKYRLIDDGDKIAVCVSGGKDSALLAKLMQMYSRFGCRRYELIYLFLDAGYGDSERDSVLGNAGRLGIELRAFSADVLEAVGNNDISPCFICSRMRRGHLYRQAKAAGCNKIALGHHYDDVITTILMGMLYGAQVQTMLPKLKSDNVDGMELIRPLYLIREQDIRAWADMCGLNFVKCACGAARKNPEDDMASKRDEVKKLIAELKKSNPHVESNIFGSVENVNLRKIIGYQKDGVRHSFLDDYE